jgi:ABC-2 type transport system permease protein
VRSGGLIISDIVPFIIIALVIIFILVRRSRNGGRPRTAAPRAAVRAPAIRLLPLPGDVGLVAAREMRARVRSRAYRAGTVLVLAGVTAAIVIPSLIGGQPHIQRVGVAGPLPAAARVAIAAEGPAIGATVQFTAEPGGQAADAALRSGAVNVAVVNSRVVTDRAVTAGDSSPTAQLTRAAARAVGDGTALSAAGLSPQQAAALAGARPAPVSSLRAAAPGFSSRTASYVGLLLVFFMLTQYNAWTLTGVLEEKSSRIVEVLLAAITPARLLAGKVLGIGLAAFVQAAVAAGVAVGLARATHSSALAGVSGPVVGATLTWLLLGYAFYSWLYAAAGSTADRQEQAQSLLLPLALPAMAGFVVSAAAATSGTPTALLRVLAFLPPTAPFAMPALVSLGAASWWQFALSALLSVAGTVAVARVAVAVYQGSILHAGGRRPLRELLARAPGEKIQS